MPRLGHTFVINSDILASLKALKARRGQASRTKQGAVDLEIVRSKLSYDPETGIFRRRSGRGTAQRNAGYLMPNGYWMVRVGRQRFLAHRLAWFRARVSRSAMQDYGYLPPPDD